MTVTIPIRGSLQLAERLGDDRAHRLVDAAHARSSPPPSSRLVSSRSESSGDTSSTSERDEHPLLAREPLLGALGELLGRRAPRGRANAAVSAQRCQRSWWSTSATEAPKRFCELRLRRQHVLALALQRAGLRKVELGREDRDEPRHGPAAATAAVGRLVERRALDLAGLVDLEDVALAQVVEALEQDAALEALRRPRGRRP